MRWTPLSSVFNCRCSLFRNASFGRGFRWGCHGSTPRPTKNRATDRGLLEHRRLVPFACFTSNERRVNGSRASTPNKRVKNPGGIPVEARAHRYRSPQPRTRAYRRPGRRPRRAPSRDRRKRSQQQSRCLQGSNHSMHRARPTPLRTHKFRVRRRCAPREEAAPTRRSRSAPRPERVR